MCFLQVLLSATFFVKVDFTRHDSLVIKQLSELYAKLNPLTTPILYEWIRPYSSTYFRVEMKYLFYINAENTPAI